MFFKKIFHPSAEEQNKQNWLLDLRAHFLNPPPPTTTILGLKRAPPRELLVSLPICRSPHVQGWISLIGWSRGRADRNAAHSSAGPWFAMWDVVVHHLFEVAL
uniref:Uncharacterized protein n=1 Tax=Eutreptiella gymnastica TaxID=73025 RepID=A0A7S4G1B4_9EUGL